MRRCCDDTQLIKDARDTQDLGIEVGLAHIEVALLPDIVDVHKGVYIRETLLYGRDK